MGVGVGGGLEQRSPVPAAWSTVSQLHHTAPRGPGLCSWTRTGSAEPAHLHHELSLRILGELGAEGPSWHRGLATSCLEAFKTTAFPPEAPGSPVEALTCEPQGRWLPSPPHRSALEGIQGTKLKLGSVKRGWDMKDRTEDLGMWADFPFPGLSEAPEDPGKTTWSCSGTKQSPASYHAGHPLLVLGQKALCTLQSTVLPLPGERPRHGLPAAHPPGL